MSFSKAKLVRFNELEAAKIKSNPIKKDGPQKRTTPPSSDAGSVRSTPCSFRTPTLAKKPNIVSSTKKPLKIDFEALNEKTKECESKTLYIHQLTKELDECKLKLHELQNEKETLLKEHQTTLNGLELDILERMNQLKKQEDDTEEKIKDLKRNHEDELKKLKKIQEYKVGQVVLDYEIKIKELKEASVEERKSIDESWLNKLKLHEEESQQKIEDIQKEKQQLDIDLNETKSNLLEMRVKYDQLVVGISLDQQETDLKLKVQELTQTLHQQKDELQKLKGELKTYQATIKNFQGTIEVLKNRLIRSDNDVEQLKEELIRCEQTIVENENKCCQLNMELQQANSEKEDLEFQFESTVTLLKDSVAATELELLNKVEEYKNQLTEQLKTNGEEGEIKDTLLKQLDENMAAIYKMNVELQTTEEMCFAKIEQLTEKIDDFKRKEKIWWQREKEFAKLGDLKAENSQLKAECEVYKKKIQHLEEIKDEKYQIIFEDHNKVSLENLEMKAKIINLNQELEEFQKIKNELEKLKIEKMALEKENTIYKNKFTEEQLKLKKYKLGNQDKENLGSPNRSLIESPNRGSGSPFGFRGSPFRERNN